MIVLEWIRMILGFSLMLLCVSVFAIEIIGVFKMKFSLNRMHAAAMGDTLGLLSGLLGLMVISGFNFTTLKMALVLVFLWCTSPIASHLIARMEYQTNEHLSEYAEIRELYDIEAEAVQRKASEEEQA